MKYRITRTTLGCDQFIELAQEEYARATSAREGLLASLSIEEKLDLAIQSYFEFELELHKWTLEHVLFSDHDWSWFISGAHALNRRIACLLSACRLYTDQTKHEISGLFGPESEERSQLCRDFSTEYDSCLGYRVLEEVRNLVQHRMLPVGHISYAQARDKRKSVSLTKVTCTPSLNVARLGEERFKAKILAEMQTLGDRVDLKPLIREYVASIGRVHNSLRMRLSAFVSDWEQTLEDVEQRFRGKFGDDLLGLAVVCVTEEGKRIESADMFRDFIDRRRRLERKNREFTQLRTQFISSEAEADK